MSSNILIVEDDPALVHAISRNLAVRGYRTASATTVGEALPILESGCPAILLVDIDLPDGSGWDVVRALRAARCSDTTIIVMSALRPNTRLAKELQCAAVLEKPFPMEALLRQVGAHLQPDRSDTAGDQEEVGTA